MLRQSSRGYEQQADSQNPSSQRVCWQETALTQWKCDTFMFAVSCIVFSDRLYPCFEGYAYIFGSIEVTWGTLRLSV